MHPSAAADNTHEVGSFPLGELLDLESLDIEVLNSDAAGLTEANSTPRSLPGHHRATLLLDGIGTSSRGNSRHASPGSSFNARQAAAAAAAGAPEAASIGAEAQAAAASDATAGRAGSIACASACDPSEQQQQPEAAGAGLNLQPSAAAVRNSGSTPAAGHAAPSQLQLPDFAAFLLPAECAFAESSIDDALTTPTPHTPVVPSIFAGDGLPGLSARASRPHYSTSSGSSSSSGGGTANSTHPTAAAAAADGNDGSCISGSCGSSGICMTQLGTCRALLIDNPEDEEFLLDPFPAAITSPSQHRHHAGAGSHAGGSRMHQESEGDDGWDEVPFTSLLCRRTLSTVSEAPNEGLEEEASTTSCCRASASPCSTPACSQAGGSLQQQQSLQQPFLQQQQQQQSVLMSGGFCCSLEQQQQQQLCTPVPAAANNNGSSNSSSDGSTLQSCQQQSLVGQMDPQQLGAVPAAEQATGYLEQLPAQAAAIVPNLGAVDAAAVQLELCSDAPAAATPAQPQQQDHQLEQEQQQERKQQGQQQSQAAVADLPPPVIAVVAGGLQGSAAATEPSKHSKSSSGSSNGSSDSGGSKVVCVTATAAPAEEELEDVWAAANKQRLQQLQQQQQLGLGCAAGVLQDSQSCILTYAAAEQQLLAAIKMQANNGSSSSSSSGGCTQQGANPQQQQQQQMPQLQQATQRPSLWQRLLVCGGCSSRSMCEQAGQQQQQLLQLAKTPFSDSAPVHLQLLQAVHAAYTGQPGPVPRYGPHWAILGFQGDDPATDLRGAGMLGLLQLLYLHTHDAAAAERLYKQAQSATHGFPLAIVSFNVTTWVLACLRAGRLDKAARQLGSHVAAANRCYCGSMYAFGARWSKGQHTMLDSGWVLKELQQHCIRHAHQMLQLADKPPADGS